MTGFLAPTPALIVLIAITDPKQVFEFSLSPLRTDADSFYDSLRIECRLMINDPGHLVLSCSLVFSLSH